EPIEGRPLCVDLIGRSGEPDLRRITRASRKVDRIVADRAIGLQIATALPPRGDGGVGKTRASDIVERDVGAELTPRRAKRSRRADTKRLIVVGCREREIILQAGNRTREAP